MRSPGLVLFVCSVPTVSSCRLYDLVLRVSWQTDACVTTLDFDRHGSPCSLEWELGLRGRIGITSPLKGFGGRRGLFTDLMAEVVGFLHRGPQASGPSPGSSSFDATGTYRRQGRAVSP